ncbi:hypothetical protein BT96DRAFT_482843 [Gymnopus androsaceus JB14]|uniref:Uncharacterized protein n=1 Tax=Gymnopus androsaceus JB14 TaxID=1447944 RepID=A0A6A4GQC9_9AGAR|nr:hypothetical protein BT96DRAFT_482843 [Gymnopus androsaceus JB14]
MSRRDSTSTCSRIQVAERNLRPESQTVNITSKVIDCHGQTQAHLERSTNGVWSIHSTDNHDDFTVKFDDALFRNILASKEPWNYAEWNTPSRINILLELLHWESKLSAEDDFKFELFRCTRRISREFEMLPSSLYVRGLMKDGNHPKWGGGFSVDTFYLQCYGTTSLDR